MNVVTPGQGIAGTLADPQELERIFGGTDVGAYADEPTESAEGDESVYAATVRAMIDDAKSFEESVLAPDRDENLHFFYGEYPEQEGEGKSSAVSTDFRDTVMAILPSLMRIFTSSERIVNCAPNSQGQEEMAKQCTDYLNYILWEDNDGFLIIHDIIKDALRCKTGVVTWYTDKVDHVTEQEFSNLTMDQVQFLIQENPSIQVLDKEMDPQYPGILKTLRVRFTKSLPLTKVESVPL